MTRDIPDPTDEVWHNRSAEEVLTHVGSSAQGLSAPEAARRLAAEGLNELIEGKRTSAIQLFLGQFKSLIIWVLIVAGVISAALGDMVDAIAILAIVILNAGIGFYQEFAAEKSIADKLSADEMRAVSKYIRTFIRNPEEVRDDDKTSGRVAAVADAERLHDGRDGWHGAHRRSRHAQRT